MKLATETFPSEVFDVHVFHFELNLIPLQELAPNCERRFLVVSFSFKLFLSHFHFHPLVLEEFCRVKERKQFFVFQFWFCSNRKEKKIRQINRKNFWHLKKKKTLKFKRFVVGVVFKTKIINKKNLQDFNNSKKTRTFAQLNCEKCATKPKKNIAQFSIFLNKFLIFFFPFFHFIVFYLRLNARSLSLSPSENLFHISFSEILSVARLGPRGASQILWVSETRTSIAHANVSWLEFADERNEGQEAEAKARAKRRRYKHTYKTYTYIQLFFYSFDFREKTFCETIKKSSMMRRFARQLGSLRWLFLLCCYPHLFTHSFWHAVKA